MNYLGNEEFFGIISNTAGGYAFYRDARLRRITRYRYNNVPADTGGRYVYVRDRTTGEYWSPSWQPVQTELDRYSCRHGLGYTIIGSRRAGVRVETTYVVPLGETLEQWRVRVVNERDEPVSLSLFGAVEFCLWDALDDATNFQRNLSTGEVEVHGNVIVHKTEYRERRDHYAYFACGDDVAGFDTQRDAFLGPYRGWARPVALEQGAATGSIAHGWSPCGVLQVDVDLVPAESRDVVFVLGYAENPRDAKFDPPGSQQVNQQPMRAALARCASSASVDRSLTALRDHWSALLGVLQVQTPNEHVDRMVNVWNAYQCMVTFNLSRSASSFESGIGRGMGFRDSNQDLLGFVHMVPERARQRILDIAATQLPAGGAYHQYQPLTKRGNDAVGSGFNDDPLWLVLAVVAYVKETADASILDEPVPYDNAPGSEAPLREHLDRSVQYTLDRLGPHGLPLIGRADWNDCLNLNCFSEEPGESFQTTGNREGGVAESVFIAALFVLATEELAELCDHEGRARDARNLRERAATMRDAVLTAGWDGEWFRRAYDYFGAPVGSHENDEGRIFIEPQGMCVMAGIGLEDGVAARALASVAELLTTPHGIVLQQPAYTRYHVELGEITSYPPGYKENAGIFCHTNPWVMIAEARLGHADTAFDYYLRINPSARQAISEVHRCEPYVYAQMIAGKDAPTHGEAKNSWLTGTAAWNFVAVTKWLLGVRPEFDGLRIDPCLPSAWDGFRTQRRFRGATYRITVDKPAGVAPRRGGWTVTVDGRPIGGDVVPVAPAGTVVDVVVQPTE